ASEEPSQFAFAVDCSSSTSHRSTGAPSIAHFAMGGMQSARSSTTPLSFASLLPATKTRHFDRSCSRRHREQRSGEIRFSTQTTSQPLPASLPLPLSLPSLLPVLSPPTNQRVPHLSRTLRCVGYKVPAHPPRRCLCFLLPTRK